MNRKSYLNMELLRFTTAGSVDDGKSTLIGRLLYDSKSIFEDQLEAVKNTSERKGLEHIDLSLLTDGLKDEREQGITIDVAYRYFATPRRKFIIADTPGHIQYTRNMVTGASTANLALLLVDARKGVIEQTYRHSYIASLLQIPHLVVCVNKMDLVDYSEDVFNSIMDSFDDFSARLDISDIRYIPISALNGDNVVNRSKNMEWYNGATLLHTLEHVHIGSDQNHLDGRFPVQTVIRPHSEQYHDFRGYAGRVQGGIFRKGEQIVVLPSGLTSTVKNIYLNGEELEEAYPPMSVTMTLEDDIDVSRGDMIAKPNNQPESSQELDAMLCWFNAAPLNLKSKYILRHTTAEMRAIVKEVVYRFDISKLSKDDNASKIQMNDIFRAKIKTTKPVLYDSYRKNRSTGSLILVDEATNETVAAGMIV